MRAFPDDLEFEPASFEVPDASERSVAIACTAR
jgi:hypothetical protein